ncbi:hypothetical protein ACVOMV_32380 [Mesorhizobium atlanticum]
MDQRRRAGASCGQRGQLSDYPTIPTADLEEGEWIALRVDGPSMNKISPPDSIIFVNLRGQAAGDQWLLRDLGRDGTGHLQALPPEPTTRPSSRRRIWISRHRSSKARSPSSDG